MNKLYIFVAVVFLIFLLLFLSSCNSRFDSNFERLEKVCWYIELKKASDQWTCFVKADKGDSISNISIYETGSSKEEVTRKAYNKLKKELGK